MCIRDSTGMVKKYVTNVTTDFEIDDETGETKVRDCLLYTSRKWIK